MVMSSSWSLLVISRRVGATSYAKLNADKVATFIRSHIICQYGVPHELISVIGVHFRGEVDTLL